MFGLPSSHGATGTASIVINKPVDEVFHFIAVDFFENYPRWSPEVQELELLSAPPLQLNSLVRQVRIDNSQRSESTFKITTYKYSLGTDWRIAIALKSNVCFTIAHLPLPVFTTHSP